MYRKANYFCDLFSPICNSPCLEMTDVLGIHCPLTQICFAPEELTTYFTTQCEKCNLI